MFRPRPTSNGMDGEKKNVVYVILALIVIGLLGWWVLSKGPSSGFEGDTASEEAPGPQLAPALQLTEKERSGDVSDTKAEIIARVNSGTPLTPEEKARIGGIMLTKANIYNFSEEERQAIFKELSEYSECSE